MSWGPVSFASFDAAKEERREKDASKLPATYVQVSKVPLPSSTRVDRLFCLHITHALPMPGGLSDRTRRADWVPDGTGARIVLLLWSPPARRDLSALSGFLGQSGSPYYSKTWAPKLHIDKCQGWFSRQSPTRQPTGLAHLRIHPRVGQTICP